MDLQVFPNPSNGILHVTIDDSAIPSAYFLRILSSSGRLVFESVLSEKSMDIDLSINPENGLLFIQLLDIDGRKLKTQKIFYK